MAKSSKSTAQKSTASKAKRKHFKTINGGKSLPQHYESVFDDTDWHPLDEHIDNNRDKKFVKNITPRTEGQKELMDSIKTHNCTIALGPAGTGKTYLAVALAVEALQAGEVDKIILSRPAMEAGESLGYLPGDMHEKMAPYLRPLYDVLGDRLGGKKVRQLLDDGTIEIAPIGFMRGRTLNNAFIVIDEAQNCTYQQLKMILSRLGWHSNMVVTGDPAQSDLLEGVSGLKDISERLTKVSNIGVIKLRQSDIVRHPLVAEMLDVL
jgi:phosphate starvation-inducible PhoH-like protein